MTRTAICTENFTRAQPDGHSHADRELLLCALRSRYRQGVGAQSCPLATPVVNFDYVFGTNAIGHLTSLTDQAGTASYTYDAWDES